MKKICSEISVPTSKLKDALKFLNIKLSGFKSPTKLWLVGSGALILGYGLSRQTGDLDCILRRGNRRILYGQIETVSSDLELPEDWLNFEFEYFNDNLEFKADWFHDFLKMPFLEIAIPKLELCLALKCSDARDSGFREKDLIDISFCVTKLGIKSLDDFYNTIEPYDLLNTLTDEESLILEKFIKSRVKL